MVTPQRTLPAEIFYRNLERGVRVRAEKIRQNIPEKMDQEKFYAIKERARSCYKQKQLDHLWTSNQNIILGLIWQLSFYISYINITNPRIA